LYTGTTFALLKQAGQGPPFYELAKSNVSGPAISAAHYLRNTSAMFSGLHALLTFVVLSSPMISS